MHPNKTNCIVIGGSAGCGTLIRQILTDLPKDFTVPMIIVRHLRHDDIDENYMDMLSEMYSINMREPEDKEPINESTVYLAPPGYHLMIEEDRTFSLNVDEKIHYTRPSIDVLFESAASVFGSQLTGILLSGSNSDGASGLCSIKKNNGLAIIQDPKTAEFPQMPESVLEKCEIDHMYKIDQISDLIIDINEMRG
jgi:two-component system chemotaxis response regulator CheB